MSIFSKLFAKFKSQPKAPVGTVKLVEDVGPTGLNFAISFNVETSSAAPDILMSIDSLSMVSLNDGARIFVENTELDVVKDSMVVMLSTAANALKQMPTLKLVRPTNTLDEAKNLLDEILKPDPTNLN